MSSKIEGAYNQRRERREGGEIRPRELDGKEFVRLNAELINRLASVPKLTPELSEQMKAKIGEIVRPLFEEGRRLPPVVAAPQCDVLYHHDSDPRGFDSIVLRWGNKLDPTPLEMRLLEKYRKGGVHVWFGSFPEEILVMDHDQLTFHFNPEITIVPEPGRNPLDAHGIYITNADIIADPTILEPYLVDGVLTPRPQRCVAYKKYGYGGGPSVPSPPTFNS